MHLQNTIQLLTTFLALTSSTTAWRPTDKPCAGHRSKLCFLDFLWCNGANSNECYYPEGVYPAGDNAGHTPALVWGKDYTINFTTTRSGPVTVWWVISGYKQDTSKQPERSGLHQSVVWEHNTTDGDRGFVFTPRPSLFPNPMAPNLTADDVPGIAIGYSYLSIQQWSANSTGQKTSDGYMDASDRFFVFPRDTIDYVDYAVEKEDEKWRKKFGLGVGLGVGLSTFFATMTGFVLALLWGKRSSSKKSGSVKGTGKA